MERDAGADANASIRRLTECRQRACAENDVAARRGAAGERRLRAHRQDARGVGDERCRFGFVSRKDDAIGEAAWHMCRVAEKRRHDRLIANDLRRRYGGSSPSLDAIRQLSLLCSVC